MDKDFYKCLEKVCRDITGDKPYKDNVPESLITDIKEKIPDYAEKYDVDNVTVYRKQGFCRIDHWWHYSENAYENFYVDKTGELAYNGDENEHGCMEVSFKLYSGVYTYWDTGANDFKHGLCKLHKQIKIIFYNHNAVYISKGENKLMPLTLKALRYYLDNPYLREFIEKFVECVGEKYPIYKDIYRSVKNDGVCLLPFTVNELSQYHNPKDLFCGKYKGASSIPYGYNKHSVNLSYLIIKSWNWVREADRGKLLQITEFPFVNYEWSGRAKDIAMRFLGAVIDNRIGLSGEKTLTLDYIRMCLLTKEKISLSFTSGRKLQEEHDRMALNAIQHTHVNREIPLVKIKADTKFKELRKILPKRYEWIKTRKRLIQETELQHNCVWSYAERINKDICQIYSYVDDKGRRYTLEFRLRHGKYYLEQIRGIYNRPDGADDVITEVDELLKNAKK